MNSNLKNHASSFFARLKVYAAYTVRYIVFICRKYPLLAAIFLLFYVFFLYKYLSPNSIQTSNLPIPQQTPQKTSFPNSPISSQTTNPTATPVIEAAQATAVRSGTDLSIRWDRPVENPAIYSDSGLLESSCQLQTCTVMLSKPTNEIKVYWRQDQDRFVKDFKISD